MRARRRVRPASFWPFTRPASRTATEWFFRASLSLPPLRRFCTRAGVPVFADIDDDFTLSPDDLQRVLSQHRNVRAVVPVHTFGHPCRVAELDDVARTYGEQRGRPIRVVYDAAHAFGSAVGERRVGIFGDAEVFSLSATKVLVSVEGGLVSSRDPELLARVRKMRNYGIEANYDAHWPGLNGKMSELHALIGLYNLKRLESLLEQRIARARYYVGLLERETSFRPPVCKPNVRHTFKDFTVMVPDRLIDRRDAVMRFLAERGIETRAYFSPPLHRQRFFARFADRPLPKTDELSRRVIALPFYTTIRESEMDYVVEALKAAERSLS